MNAASLMAVSTAEGNAAGAGAQSVRPASAGSRTQTASGKNSFSDTFDALQKKTDAAASRTNARESTAGKTPSSGADAAPTQDTQDVTAKEPKAVAQPQKEQGGQKSAQTGADDAAAVSSAAAAAVLSAVPADAAADADAGLDDALAEILERYGLTAAQLADAGQGLLQQVPPGTLKNRNFLLALSGQPLAQAGEESPTAAFEIPAALQTAALSGQLRAAMQADVLRTAENLPAVAADNAELLAQATTEGLIANTEQQLAQNAQQMPAAQAQQNSAADVLIDSAIQNVVKGTPLVQEAAAPAVQAQQPLEGQKLTDLVGDTLTEDGAETPSPLDVLAQRTMRRDAAGQETAQHEQQQAETGAQQLPFARAENAAEQAPRPAEPAPQAPQPITPHTGYAPVQEAAQAESAQAAQPERPQPDYEIPRQIVEQARLLRTLTDTQMVIRLKPEHLGELTLRVAVGSDGAVQASFHSDNAHVRNVIENSLVQLRQELNNQGLKVDRVGVYTGLADGQMPQGQGQEAWQQNRSGQSDTHVYARGDADDYLDEIDGAPLVQGAETGGVMTADGVDYRV